MPITTVRGAQITDASITEVDVLLADVTTLDVSTTMHGLVPKGTNVGNFLKDTAAWSAVTKTDVGLSNVDNTSNTTERAATRTLTNARVTKRVSALSANSATPSINTDNFDVVNITAQTLAITSFTTNLTGSPVDGNELRISVTGTTAVALTFGASFEAGAATLPTTTVSTTRLDMLFYWNTATSKWRIMAQG